MGTVILFYKKYVGEELFSPFKNCSNMKIFYSIHVIDQRHQVDHTSLKRFSYLKTNETILAMLDYLSYWSDIGKLGW